MKKKFIRPIVSMLLIIALSFSLMACGSDNNNNNTEKEPAAENNDKKEEDAPVPDESTDDTDNTDQNNTEPDDTADTNDGNTAGVGDSLEDDTWKITLQDAKQYAAVEDEYFSDEPEDGKVYLVLFFEIENISDEDETFSMLLYDCYVDDMSVSESFLINDPEGWSMLSGDVAVGKKMQGYVAWEIEEGWQEFEFNYSELSFTGSDKLTFIVTPGDLS